MFILDTMLFGGIRLVLNQIATAVEAEMHDDAPLRERLLEAQMRLELGEIDETEFRAVERDVLARLREMHANRPGALSMSANDRVAAVEIETFDSEANGEDGGNGRTQRNGGTEKN